MSSFNERERAYEEKFKRDEEFRFRVGQRRNKLLGRWTAEKLDLAGETAEQYARDFRAALFHRKDEDVVQHITAELNRKGITVTAEQIRHEMGLLLAKAKRDLMNE
jgi:hypothetical protein